MCDKPGNVVLRVCVQIRAVSLPKTVFTHDSALYSRNTPAGELLLCSWSLSDVLSFVFSELGSNPLNSAGIDEGAFADLKRVSYIRIADTNITEIPKGTDQISVWTNPSFIGHFGFITSHTQSRQSAFEAKIKCFSSLCHRSKVTHCHFLWFQSSYAFLGLPSSLSELHLDANKITKVTATSLQGLKNLAK